MGNALQPPAASDSLQAHEKLTFENGPYRYAITRTPEGGLYTVTDGSDTISTPVQWSFGHGNAGQTYVLEHDGHFYESRVSFYLRPNGLEQTLGAPPGAVPRNLDEALGRRMTPDDVRGCFGCHATGAIRAGKTDLEHFTPGLQCEGCHGPGTAHIEAVSKGRFEDLHINTLKNMTAESQSDFCGACHRTWSQVMLMDLQGPANVRFQPYRIANSRCYDTTDQRIRCTACHDPHQPVVRDAKSYDAKCLACHASAHDTAAKDAPACPVGQEACSSCHMPRVEIPGAYFQFADHQIRIHRPDDPYPN
jgi:Cytochrome c554 and c-prime